MSDKYYVYRPMLDLIGFTEGTDKGRGYNETLAYGKFTGGDVNLISMTLTSVDVLQTKMLGHPKNSFNTSAIGRYQIVRTTRRNIQKTLNLAGAELFNADMQDRMACYLLGVRGIDKYLSGRMAEDTLINNLAQEWASLPTTGDKGYYGGQNAAVKSARVRQVLAEVRKRHKEGQPKQVVEVVPPVVEKEVRKKTGILSGWFGGGFSLSGLAAWLAGGIDYKVLLIVIAVAAVGSGVFLVGGEWIVRRVRSISAALEGEPGE